MNKVFCLLAGLLISNSYAATYGGGSGTEADPYQIWTPDQMNSIGLNPDDWGSGFILMADIDMSAFTSTSYNRIGTASYNAFVGTFNGNGHVIRNLTWTTTSVVHWVGLFGAITNARIQNLIMENVSISTGGNYVGGLVGWNDYGTLTGCTVTGTVSGKEIVGGMIGYNNQGALTDCYAGGTVCGTGAYVGGMVGDNEQGTLTGCFAAGTVSGTGYSSVGGLAGKNTYGSISSCGASGSVTGTGEGGGVGGLVGTSNYGTIVNCYATGTANGTGTGGGVGGLLGGSSNTELISCRASGSVTGATQGIGGLVGSAYESSMTGCYASGPVQGQESVGGLVGFYQSGLLTACHAYGSVSGKSQVGGLIGLNSGSLTACHAAGSVTGTSQHIGGLLGRTSFGTVTSCFATGSVLGTGSQIYYIGGLIGNNNGSPVNCYASGSVTSSGQYNYYVGGLTGGNYGSPANCYATGLVRVTGNSNYNIGGLIGYNLSGTPTACFWDVQTSTKTTSEGGTGKTTAQMMTLSTFTSAGWDFTETDGDAADWMMLREGEDYPRLAWQTVFAGDIAGFYGVDTTDLMKIVNHWLAQGCPSGCEQADIDHNSRVDLVDLAILAADWLKK